MVSFWKISRSSSLQAALAAMLSLTVGVVPVVLASESSPQSAKPPTPAACAEEASVLCTMEFAPAVCRYQGQEFRGSNRCQAMKAARLHACEKKQKWVKSEVVCRAEPQQ